MPELTKVQTGFLEPQGPFKLDPGTESAPGIYLEGDENTGLYRSAENEIAVTVDGTQKFKFTSEGLNFNGTSLDGTPFMGAIDKDITDTAVDIFVYDTSKDSDGGTWRHRTQHTSWYNETLNTSTRGSRREFPAVAVIVAEANQVTIYDGDDPDLPMWMVFNKPSAGYTEAIAYGNNIRAVYHLNGKLSVSTNDGHSLIDFISEDCRTLRASTQNNKNAAMYGGIVNRNGNMTFVLNVFNSSYNIGSSSSANDVAMTVLPNAPIDPATGLPIPTIACLVGETQVTLENGETKRIDEIKPGEFVKTLEGNHEVLNWFDQGIKETIELEFDNGTKLICTSDHKIRTTDGWVEAGNLTEEHEIISL